MDTFGYSNWTVIPKHTLKLVLEVIKQGNIKLTCLTKAPASTLLTFVCFVCLIVWSLPGRGKNKPDSQSLQFIPKVSCWVEVRILSGPRSHKFSKPDSLTYVFMDLALCSGHAVMVEQEGPYPTCSHKAGSMKWATELLRETHSFANVYRSSLHAQVLDFTRSHEHMN